MPNPTPEAVQDYLNRQQQAQSIQRQFDDLPESDHDEVGAVRRGLDAEADRLGDECASLVSSYNTSVRDLHAIRRTIADGTADPRVATQELSKIRARIAGLNRRASATTQRAESLEARRQNPQAYAAELVNKYPSLRR